MHLRIISKLKFLYEEKIHSIPILLLHSRIHKHKFSSHQLPKAFRYLYYSIPTFCATALLLLLSNLFIINPSNKTYAETNEENTDSDIMPLASTATLTLANNNPSANISNTTTPGSTAYVSTDVTYSASDISDYAINISYASGQSAPSSGGKTLGGAGGKAVASMEGNTWGYSWVDIATTMTETQMSTLIYNSMPASGSASVVPKTTASSVNKTSKIVFAAKFGSDAPTGHYATSVQLSMVATPLTTYTISYNANGGSGAPAAESVKAADSTKAFTVSSTKPTLSGRTFLGWATTASAYYPEIAYDSGKNVTLTAANPNLTLYAVWGWRQHFLLD